MATVKSNALPPSLSSWCSNINSDGEFGALNEQNHTQTRHAGRQTFFRGLPITVYDVLSMLSSGMTQEEVLTDFPELMAEDILSVLAYAADREHQV
ncbi:MAG TPA: DUF433 domain-containing protein [Rhodoferax sp.]|nr:DUF433 domain-containing protein [Rhodoferax sp.]